MFHMRIASESRTRLSFLELTILARREEGARDCDAQISPVSSAPPMLGGQDKVVYLLRTPRLIVLALVADSRFSMTGMRGRALSDRLGTTRWIIGGCFCNMRPRSDECVTTRSMRALSAFRSRQVVSKKQRNWRVSRSSCA